MNERKQCREFGLVASGALMVIALLRYRSHHGWAVPVGIAIASALFAIVAPAALAPVYRTWVKIRTALVWFNTRLLLGLIYFLIVTPFALVRQFSGADPLRLRSDTTAASYWEDYEDVCDRERLDHLY
jgi:hypothetical protein